MVKDILNLKNDLKASFSKVKEHINSLETQINDLKAQISGIKSVLEAINSQNELKSNQKEAPSAQSSIGNKGVHSFIHSIVHSNIQTPNTAELLGNITKQELLVLLTIAQLEEEMQNVTYFDIAKWLKLSQGCIRGYITSLMRKNALIYKEKYNNKITIIKTTPHFKSFNRQALIDAFYNVDPHQKRLFE